MTPDPSSPAPEPRRRWHRILLGDLDGLILWIFAVGIAGGATGVAYLGCLHELTRLLGPERWSIVAHLVVMMAVGGAVTLLVKWLGSPGDVELMVNNIHLLGGHNEVQQL